MFRNLIATLAVVLGFGVAHAADTGGSEFFHQSGAGQSELTPQLSYSSITIKPKGGGNSITQSGIQHLGVVYEYGVNEMLALSAGLGYSSLTTNTTPSTTQSGLEDILLALHGTSGMGMGNLRYGLNLNLGLEKTKTETSGNSNVSSGGIGLQPYVGWDMAAGPGMWGARLSYQYLLDRTSTSPTGIDTKTKGGSVLGLATFYEYMLSDMVLGAQLRYDMPGDTTADTPGAVAVQTSPMLTVGVYTRIPLGMGALLAGLDYGTLSGSKYQSTTDNVDSIAGFALRVAYRLTF